MVALTIAALSAGRDVVGAGIGGSGVHRHVFPIVIVPAVVHQVIVVGVDLVVREVINRHGPGHGLLNAVTRREHIRGELNTTLREVARVHDVEPNLALTAVIADTAIVSTIASHFSGRALVPLAVGLIIIVHVLDIGPKFEALGVVSVIRTRHNSRCREFDGLASVGELTRGAIVPIPQNRADVVGVHDFKADTGRSSIRSYSTVHCVVGAQGARGLDLLLGITLKVVELEVLAQRKILVLFCRLVPAVNERL